VSIQEKALTSRQVFLSRSFVLSFSSFFFLWISFDVFILFPLFILRNGGDSIDVGIQTAIFFFPAVVIRPVAGWLTDRIGRVKVLWFGSALMLITSFLFLLFHGSYQEIRWYLGTVLFLRGLGFSSFFTAFFTYVADLSSSGNRARVIGMFGVSGLVAHGIAPKLGEIVLQRHGFDGFFIFSGLLAFLSLCISAFMKENHVPAISEEKGFEIFRSVTVARSNWIILPGAFAFGYAESSLDTFGAPYFDALQKGSVGYYFLLYGLTAAVIRVFLGGLADRHARWKLVTIFFALFAAGVLLIIVEPVEHLYFLSAIVAGGAHGILFPSMTAMALDAHPARFRGTVTSVFTAVLELGFAGGSFILGVVVSVWGYRTMFVSASIIAFLFSIYVALFNRRLTPKQQSGIIHTSPSQSGL